MSNNLIKNSSIYFIGSFVSSVLGIILLPVYTKHMSVEDFGIVSSMKVLIAILTIFFTFAIEKSVYRLYFEYKTQEEKKQFFGTVYISVFMFSLVFSILLFLFNDIISNVYTKLSFYPYFVLAISYTFFHSFSLVPIIYFQIIQKPYQYIGLTLLKLLTNNLLIIYFVVFKEHGAIGYLGANMLAVVIDLPIFLFIIIKTSSFSFTSSIFFSILKYSFPLIPSQAAAIVISMSDRIFIERYHTLSDVGVYSLAYRIGTLIIFFTGAFYKAYNPYFYKIANSTPPDIAKNLLQKTNHSFIFGSLFLGFCLALFSNEIIDIFFDVRYANAKNIIPIIAVGYAMSQTFDGLFNLSLYQAKKTSFIFYSAILGAFVNIGFNFLFIPHYGMLGAAYATVFTFFFTFNIKYLFVKKSFFVPYKWMSIFSFIFLLSTIYIVFHYLKLSFILSLSLKVITVLVILLILIRISNLQWLNNHILQRK
ncbi:MAG: oligosaccharide flippase family protein [Bacteroidales bacterium]